MHQALIRYRTRPEQAAANEELIRAVYEELGKTQPDGLSYATFLLADQVTFLHLVRTGSRKPPGDGARSPGRPVSRRATRSTPPGRGARTEDARDA